ncbi:Nucleoporin2 domain-containing protein/Nup96 domain-containing protein [Cephalotus follicularis]|uniref:Nucleoporin2 domain-containing protein/Nup96 domain-containing protein n=1 Tax=Cephalotus follicularis TaxID=3775 RepID=A0A1Q3BWU0_CEPFO|nr:Nucleoporin2 domain-containing protein/Nup96 domain-containing protein [Cephalotus follicularis]
MLCRVENVDEQTSNLHVAYQYKKRRISANIDSLSYKVLKDMEDFLPTLSLPDYYMEPCLKELAAQEFIDPGYCSRVPDFTVGRFGYGFIKFLGKTDVRWLDVDQIVKIHKHEVVVYEDESAKPIVGQGLNKAAEVTLILKMKLTDLEEEQLHDILKKLRESTERQGARFISFDLENGEWKFSVQHFSRFGLSEDDEEDIAMDDAIPVEDPLDNNSVGETSDIDEEPQIVLTGPELSHSLPTHLGLDPVKMKEMRMLMFPVNEEEEVEDFNGIPSNQKSSFGKNHKRPLHDSIQTMNHRSSPPARKTPLALLEYNPVTFDSSSSKTILMAQQNSGMPVKAIKAEGFKLDLKCETPVTGSHSRNIVDAALFMGRSFRVGWGPNGVLVHSGAPIGINDSQRVISSIINIEKVAIDKVVRDEANKVRKELVDIAFDAPLNLHKTLIHETKEVKFGSFQLKLQKVVCNRLMLSEICRSYIDIIERQLEVPGLPSSARLVLMNQVMVWELIKVLFSEKENSGQSKSAGADDEEDMMQHTPEVDQEALPFIRRAEFSCWLQESVCHRVQEDVSSLNDSNYLEHILLLLTGRQLDAAVEVASSRGDVRLACLLSQAGGSMENRADIARQLDFWRDNGMDFNFIEKDRIRLYELLAGNVHGAFHDVKIDWKRFLGSLMWYQLPPDTSLPIVFQTYQHLIDGVKAPYPVPIYVDEGPVEEAENWNTEEHFDLSYYLMLLHASEETTLGFLKTMFSAFSSTQDPLDYHMIWHQRVVLEAVGAFSSDDLQILDMGIVSQLLCLGQCHWAIYVVLHMPHHDDYPHLQASLTREILFQYCESWSSEESQRQFIEDLGVPAAWIHEAMAVYYKYHGDLPKALEHFLECENWQKAHSIFITAVAHTLFLSANHSEIWRIATSMEDHKLEIENWDLGAGIYISFYLLRNSLQEDNNTMIELDILDSKNSACRDFLSHLSESLKVWDSRLPVDARIAYSKMAEEISDLLLSDFSEDSTRETQLNCFNTVFSAPISEHLRSSHLQDAVSLFTCYLSEMAT